VLDELMQVTWVKFWHSYTPAKFGVVTELAQVLQYLKLCARSAVLDAARHRRETTRLDPDLSVADPHPSPDEAHLAAVERAALWRLVEGQLHDERERVLLQLTYGFGLKAAAVHARRPDLFASVQEVYRVTRNVLDRLRRSHVLQEWFAA
jgi:DNA-directed RNA polymerase specialized sigma24 family protein